MSDGCYVSVYPDRGSQQYCERRPAMFVHHPGGGGPICKQHREEFGIVVRRCQARVGGKICGAMNTTDNLWCGACETPYKPHNRLPGTPRVTVTFELDVEHVDRDDADEIIKGILGSSSHPIRSVTVDTPSAI